MTNPELEIVWDGGSLDLMGENDTPYGPVTIQALADGTEWGNPQSVRRALFSALADGSASALERHDNRTITVKLRLTAADSAALAGGEAPLHMLSGVRRAELRWTPPNDFAAPAVYIVVASDLSHQMDDFAENRCRRTYTLTLVCLPFARSLDPVAIEALSAFVGAPTVLDDCTSTTGWASLIGGATFAVGSGGVEVTAPYNGGLSINATLTKPLARTKRYLALEAELVTGSHFVGGAFRPTVRTDSGWTSGPLEVVGAEGKWTFYDLPSTLGAIQEIRLGFYPMDMSGAYIIARILTIAESDVPAATAGRQSMRVITTPGSARADGSLLIEARDADDDGSGTPLGQVIVYTGPQYDPRLSVGRTDAATVDATALSGKQVTRTDDYIGFRRPVSSFVDGSHALWVHAKGTASASCTWTVAAAVVPAGGPLAEAITSSDPWSVTTVFTGSGYNLLNLGTLDLPGFDVGAASGFELIFTLTVTGTVTLDEALVFNRSLGSLTIVDTRDRDSMLETAGVWARVDGGGATRVWLDAASLEGNSRIVAGSPSRSLSLPVSLATELRSWDGAHLFTPDATFVYVGTTGVADPMVTGTFRPAWHTHPAS